MNKAKLIELLSLAIQVSGDVRFADRSDSLLDVIAEADLNNPMVCLLITNINAVSELIFDNSCLPFLPYKVAPDEFLLMSDFDGEVNFLSLSNVFALILSVKGIELTFGKTANKELHSVREADLKRKFIEYASIFPVGQIVSPIEKAEAILLSELATVIGPIAEAVQLLATSASDVTESQLSPVSSEPHAHAPSETIEQYEPFDLDNFEADADPFASSHPRA